MLAGVSFASAARRKSVVVDYSAQGETPPANDSVFEHFRSSVPFVAGTIYLLWVLAGVFWYKYYMSWNFATAFYYAMDAGLSIGFCAPCERDDITRSFTIVYVLLGSSVISGAVEHFLAYVVEPKVRFLPSTQNAITIIFSRSTSIFDMTRDLIHKLKYCVGWYSNRGRVVSVAIFIFWMGLGTAYGMVFEGWTFITSLYWAITTASTGGLWSPYCLSTNASGTTCNMGVQRGALMGVFMLIGVPSALCFIYITFFPSHLKKYLIVQFTHIRLASLPPWWSITSLQKRIEKDWSAQSQTQIFSLLQIFYL